MNTWLWIARSVAAALLGILVFVCFLSYTLVTHFTGKLLADDFYTELLLDHDTYNRIYSEVLMDDDVRQYSRDLTGGIQVLSHEDLVGLAREIAPPEYIQVQFEGNIGRTTDYLRGETDALDLSLDLGPPLARVDPVLFADIDRRIDELDVVELDPNLSPSQQVVWAHDITESSLQSLAAGRMPEAVPSIELIPGPRRDEVFSILLPGLINYPGLEPRARAGLEIRSEDLRREFVAGETHQFLKVAARAVLEPAVDDVLAGLRQYLDSQDRLDLIETAARNNDDATEASLRANLAGFREQIGRIRTIGQTTALVVGIGAIVVMVLIYLPSVTNALRWPGLTLLLSGVVIFLVGRVVENRLPPLLSDLMDAGAPALGGLPPAAAALTVEIMRSAGERAVEGLASPLWLLIIMGAVLLGASFLVPWLRRYYPGLR
jgi:hypothetical protein